MQQFTTADFRRLGVCRSGLARVEAFGGAIENTLAGWQAYIDANPDAWTAPVFTAWTLHRRDVINCPDLVWQIARIAFREQRNPVLRVFADTLGPENWRDAYAAAAAAGAADAQSGVKGEIIALAVAALDGREWNEVPA